MTEPTWGGREPEDAAGGPLLPSGELAPHPAEAEAGSLPELEQAEEWAPAATAVVEAEPAEAPAEEHASAEFSVPDGYVLLEGAPDGAHRSVGLVVSRYNAAVTNRLLAGALDALAEAGVAREAITIMPVPGAFELPLAAMALAKTRRYVAIVALGCVIRGETPHFDYVAGEAASGLQLAAIETGVPVAFGLLTCDTVEQAEARVGKGAEAVRTALEMADAFARLRATAAGSYATSPG